MPAIEDSISLLNSNINKLFKSSGENLFVLSQDGISVFLIEKNLSFNQIPMLHLSLSLFLKTTKNGTFWVATKNQVIIILIDLSLNRALCHSIP